MNAIRVVQLGLGPIGQACVRELSRRATIELVGGVDVDPSKVGRDLGEVCGLVERSHGLRFLVLLDRAMPDWWERKQELDEAEASGDKAI